MIELYQERVRSSESINRLFRLLKGKIGQEVKLIGECDKCLGMIESLTSRSAQEWSFLLLIWRPRVRFARNAIFLSIEKFRPYQLPNIRLPSISDLPIEKTN